jgi:pyrroloquinoline quinone biosynthesis protein E
MSSHPLALIAEITHRCPLHCVYCSNPLQMMGAKLELTTDEWARVFRQAAELGVLHLHLTGGEPVARVDLTELVQAAREAALYTNLITSGLGLNDDRLQALVDVGLDHIQISFQDSRDTAANWIAGAKAHAHKVALARAIHNHRLAFTANLVVHRQNLDHLAEMIEFLAGLEPDRMEIAHAQYYGWALENRASLMPTRSQLERAVEVVAEAEKRFAGKIRIDSVVPDYYAQYPKACMGGWGRKLMLIDPAGRALPCHAAGVLPGIKFDSVRDRSLRWLWEESSAFQRFRGEEWMQEPCRSCDRRHEDFGGCRCQAFLLTGDEKATDPTCSKAPQHGLIDAALLTANREGTAEQAVTADSFHQLQERARALWSYRVNPE